MSCHSTVVVTRVSGSVIHRTASGSSSWSSASVTGDPLLVRMSRPRRGLQSTLVAKAGHGNDGYRNGPVYVGGMTPESKAGEALAKLFTFVAAKTIMEEIEGYDNEGAGAAGDPVWSGLQDALANGMGDRFVEGLMNHPDHHMRMTAVRIMEVRAAYMEDGFNWDAMRAAAAEVCAAEKARAMGEYLRGAVGGGAEASPPDEPPCSA